jgi:hypothetical protein
MERHRRLDRQLEYRLKVALYIARATLDSRIEVQAAVPLRRP